MLLSYATQFLPLRRISGCPWLSGLNNDSFPVQMNASNKLAPMLKGLRLVKHISLGTVSYQPGKVTLRIITARTLNNTPLSLVLPRNFPLNFTSPISSSPRSLPLGSATPSKAPEIYLTLSCSYFPKSWFSRCALNPLFSKQRSGGSPS